MKYKNWQLLLGGIVIAGVSALITLRLMKKERLGAATWLNTALTQAEANAIAQQIKALDQGTYTADVATTEKIKKQRAELVQKLTDAGYELKIQDCVGMTADGKTSCPHYLAVKKTTDNFKGRITVELLEDAKTWNGKVLTKGTQFDVYYEEGRGYCTAGGRSANCFTKDKFKIISYKGNI